MTKVEEWINSLTQPTIKKILENAYITGGLVNNILDTDNREIENISKINLEDKKRIKDLELELVQSRVQNRNDALIFSKEISVFGKEMAETRNVLLTKQFSNEKNNIQFSNIIENISNKINTSKDEIIKNHLQLENKLTSNYARGKMAENWVEEILTTMKCGYTNVTREKYGTDFHCKLNNCEFLIESKNTQTITNEHKERFVHDIKNSTNRVTISFAILVGQKATSCVYQIDLKHIIIEERNIFLFYVYDGFNNPDRLRIAIEMGKNLSQYSQYAFFTLDIIDTINLTINELDNLQKTSKYLNKNIKELSSQCNIIDDSISSIRCFICKILKSTKDNSDRKNDKNNEDINYITNANNIDDINVVKDNINDKTKNNIDKKENYREKRDRENVICVTLVKDMLLKNIKPTTEIVLKAIQNKFGDEVNASGILNKHLGGIKNLIINANIMLNNKTTKKNNLVTKKR